MLYVCDIKIIITLYINNAHPHTQRTPTHIMNRDTTITEQRLSSIQNEDIPFFSLCGVETIGKIVDIYDGDTCSIVIIVEHEQGQPDVLYKYKCRLMGIDTPEIKPLLKKENREAEIEHALSAKYRFFMLGADCCGGGGIGATSDCPEHTNAIHGGGGEGIGATDANELDKKGYRKLLQLNTKIIRVLCHEFDKYGRLLVSLYDRLEGGGGGGGGGCGVSKSYNEIMVEEGYAVRYDGGHKSEW